VVVYSVSHSAYCITYYSNNCAMPDWHMCTVSASLEDLYHIKEILQHFIAQELHLL